MSQMLFGIEKLILGKEVEKAIGHSHVTVNLLICKTTSDMLRTIWAFKTMELIMNNCFAIQGYRAVNILSRVSKYLCIHYF